MRAVVIRLIGLESDRLIACDNLVCRAGERKRVSIDELHLATQQGRSHHEGIRNTLDNDGTAGGGTLDHRDLIRRHQRLGGTSEITQISIGNDFPGLQGQGAPVGTVVIDLAIPGQRRTLDHISHKVTRHPGGEGIAEGAAVQAHLDNRDAALQDG